MRGAGRAAHHRSFLFCALTDNRATPPRARAQATAAILDPRGCSRCHQGSRVQGRSLPTPFQQPVQPATARVPRSGANFPRRTHGPPQAPATSRRPLPPQALPAHPNCDCHTPPSPGLNEQVSPNQLMLSPPLAWVGKRCLTEAHTQRRGHNQS